MKFNMLLAVVGALGVMVSAVPTQPAANSASAELSAALAGTMNVDLTGINALSDPAHIDATCGDCFNAYIKCCAEQPNNKYWTAACSFLVCRADQICRTCGYSNCN
ncbi:hypothetical protein BU16DRAFT_528617 [Lophium mytilinum]|uniref:Fungal calcium binding protein domain-containing protein n=1 Tax=Lophium mytilinum TaxID=390894 RepID=A0A6A6QM23_9PEZI|nr:hypothetical protein BU16DRAFT_528617 [Lophium mytilinum]